MHDSLYFLSTFQNCKNNLCDWRIAEKWVMGLICAEGQMEYLSQPTLSKCLP